MAYIPDNPNNELIDLFQNALTKTVITTMVIITYQSRFTIGVLASEG